MRRVKKKYKYLILSVTIFILLAVIILIVIIKPNETKKIKNEPINRVVINDSEEINRNLLAKSEDKDVSKKEVKIKRNTKLRTDKDKKSEVITTIKKGDTVTVIEEVSNGLCKVKYKNNEGYIKSSSIDDK